MNHGRDPRARPPAGYTERMERKILHTLGWVLDVAVVLGAVAAGTAIGDLMLHL